MAPFGNGLKYNTE
jgi:hypothetical protein